MSQQFREINCVARRCKRGARHRLLRLVKVLEVPAAHRFDVPTGGALGRNGETVVVEHLEQTRHNFLGAVLVSYRALCRAPTAGVTDGLEQQSRRARRTCRVNTPTVPPFNETRDLHWFNTIEVIPCPSRCPRAAPRSIVSAGSASSGFAWFVSAPCTCLCHNRSHVMGKVVVNVVVPTADDVRFGVHYGFWPIGARRWVSVRRGVG